MGQKGDTRFLIFGSYSLEGFILQFSEHEAKKGSFHLEKECDFSTSSKNWNI